MSRPVHGCFNRESHQLLHFFGGHTIRFGHDHYRRSRQVRKYIDFGMIGRIETAHQQKHRCHQHQDTVVEGKMYDFVQHNLLF